MWAFRENRWSEIRPFLKGINEDSLFFPQFFFPILMQFGSEYVAINWPNGEAIHTNGPWEGQTDFTYGSASN
jgi:hypothetical protein